MISMLVAISSAVAADFFVRNSPGYPKDQRNFLMIMGKISYGDDAKFKAVLLDAVRRGIFIDTIVIYSPGGNVHAGLKIGRYVRMLRTQTYGPYVTEPHFVGTQFCPVYSSNRSEYFVMEYNWKTGRGDARCICASACFLIWAAGIWGVGNTGTLNEKILIHRIAFDPNEYGNLPEHEAQHRYEIAQKQMEVYLREMGVPEFTIQRMFTIPSARTEFLSKQEQAVLKQTPPYLGELVSAKCRNDKDGTCFERLRRELFLAGAKQVENAD
jgi:hypothetical protein